MEHLINTIKTNGGKEWIKEDMHRIYISSKTFISVARTLGLSCDFVGGVSQAVTRISVEKPECKAWFNVKNGKFESKKVTIKCFFDTYTNEEIKKLIND